MITYAEYLKREVALGAATKNNTDKVKARFIELQILREKNKMQQLEYNTLENAMKLRFRSEQANQKAKNLLGKAESESRKIDTHAKILIGLAAIEVSKTDQKLNEDLLSRACSMTSAPIDVITMLLDIQKNLPADISTGEMYGK